MKSDGSVNVFNATAYLEADEVTTAKVSGMRGSLKLISESGLYKLVMRSNKPEATVFRNWVTRVVLPALRKDGNYMVFS